MVGDVLTDAREIAVDTQRSPFAGIDTEGVVDTDGATETGDVTGIIDHTDLETLHLNCHLQGVIESRSSRTVNTQDRLCPTDLKTKTLFRFLYRP